MVAGWERVRWQEGDLFSFVDTRQREAETSKSNDQEEQGNIIECYGYAGFQMPKFPKTTQSCTRLTRDQMVETLSAIQRLPVVAMAPKQNAMSISKHLLGGLQKLQYLYLANVEINQVAGELVPFPSTLTSLVWLNANFNQLPFHLNLKSLAILKLSNCNQLQTLPPDFVQLSALRHLEILQAKSLVSLPESFGQLLHLECLELIFCPRLSSLPEAFGGLSKLKELKVVHCGFRILPQNFGWLGELRFMTITSCHDLETLPVNFGHLPKLQKLEVKQCPKLHMLPQTFGQLPTLESLLLEDCNALSIHPDGVGHLSRLKHLAIDGCHLSQTLPNALKRLVGLEDLTLRDSTVESILESTESLILLKTLKLLWIYVAPRFPIPSGWLRNVMTPWNCQRPQGWTFNITEGKFNLVESQKDEEQRLEQMVVYILAEAHPKLMRKVEAKDYKGAHAEFFVDFEPPSGHNSHALFYLQERGILKRLNWDLTGALADLTEVLDRGLKIGEDDYMCRKHRGFVSFLMGDWEGAYVDFEKALEILQDNPVEEHCSTSSVLEDGSGELQCLGSYSVKCLGFNL